MQLEDYFEFLNPDDIRIKGHRIGIDNVIQYYLQGYSPEQILEELPSLNLEKIYATLTYYLHNRFKYVAVSKVARTAVSRIISKSFTFDTTFKNIKGATRARVAKPLVKIRFFLGHS
ncbi:DUF433 domain-containing protein [Komarekiella delphini-convector]|uniref:DUF433 domain-containing protein n=1 Tax=Komarekiella delphini-convector TaxID=3050158 RepID=UPI001CD82E69|nr:DUF433 domain-containing protein [Komarekiella delphini-convector]